MCEKVITAQDIEKTIYPHFMLKEIYQQPEVFKKTLEGRINGNSADFSELGIPVEEIKNWKKIFFVACGTSYHASLVGKEILERCTNIPVEVELASEYRYRKALVDKDTLVIVISQSGETTDTLESIQKSKDAGAKVLAITNVVDSPIARKSNYVAYIWAGKEVSIASTKAYTATLIALYLLTLYIAEIKGTMDQKELSLLVTELAKMPHYGKLALEDAMPKEIAEFLKPETDAFYVGRGIDKLIALEGVLKLKETSYMHAEAYAAGELKHGTFALLSNETNMMVINTQKELSDKTLLNAQEVREKGARLFILAQAGDEESKNYADKVLYIPKMHDFFTPIIAAIPLQLLAYYTALGKGRNVDQPRNLTKAVTEE